MLMGARWCENCRILDDHPFFSGELMSTVECIKVFIAQKEKSLSGLE